MAEMPPARVLIDFPSPGNAKKYGNVTIKHAYASILRSKEQITNSLDEYEEALSLDVGKNSDKNNAKPSRLPKFFVTNAALVGNAMIAKPEAPNFSIYKARLQKSSNSIGPSVSIEAPEAGVYTQIQGVSISAPSTGKTLSSGPLGNNTWDLEPTEDGTVGFYEGDFGIYFGTDRSLVERNITSAFRLLENQPFAFTFSIAKIFNVEQFEAAKEASDNTEQVNSEEGSDVETVVNPSISITFGIDYKLTIYMDGSCTLFYRGSQIGKRSLIPSYKPTNLAPDADVITIYPLMNSIYVYRGVPSIEATVKKQFVAFGFKDPIKVEKGSITLTFRGCFGSFNFSPILHPRNAVIQSPIMKVPPGAGSPTYNSSFVGKIGVGTRGNNPKIPDKNDRQGLYAYLKSFIGDTPFKLEQRSGSSGNFTYRLTIGVKNSLADNQNGADANEFIQSNIYSPAIFSSHFTFIQQATGSGGGAGDVSDDDILSATVQQSVESQRATIVLDNRKYTNAKGGKYSKSSGFTGIKYIRIRMGFGDEPLQTVFTGYTTRWTRSRSGSTQSTLTIECTDSTLKAKEQFAVNLPFFDGWCHLGAMAYLLKEAGYDADQINMPAVSGSVDQQNGGCFDGHADSQSSSDMVHAVLPLAILGVSEPAYNFSFGTPLWTCMQRIREFTNWFLYADHEGVINYSPPSGILSNTSRVFKEVDAVGNFDEILNQLEDVEDTAEMRNSVVVQGNVFVYNQDNPEFSQWATHVHIKSAFPDKQKDTDPFFAPYPRMAFIRNPKFEDVNRTRANAVEIFRRLTRDRSTLTFSAWGQIDLHPYDIVRINESIMNETGANGKSYVIAAHTLVADGKNHTILSSFNCETLDAASLTYDPNLPPGRRD